MYNEWMNLLPKLVENLNKLDSLSCPNCGAHQIDYLYIGDKRSRIGYLQVWCSDCNKGTYISRTKAPEGAKMIDFDETEKRDTLVPDYEFVNPE